MEEKEENYELIKSIYNGILIPAYFLSIFLIIILFDCWIGNSNLFTLFFEYTLTTSDKYFILGFFIILIIFIIFIEILKPKRKPTVIYSLKVIREII